MLACWDQGLRCRFANHAYKNWFGVEPSQLLGTSIQQLLGPSLFEKNEPFMRAALAGREQVFERTIPGPDGVQRHSLARYTPDVEDGAVNGFFVEVTDVGEMRAVKLFLEREALALEIRRERVRPSKRRRSDIEKAELIREAQAEALAQEAAQRQRRNVFLLQLAHELRNSLAPIALDAHLVGKLESKPEMAPSVQARMLRQIQQLTGLVEDLFDLSGIDNGVLAVNRQRIDLRSVIDMAVETSAPLIEAARHELSLEMPDDPIPVNADKRRLVQVFANLLNNAAKYTPAGGRIGVRVRVSSGRVDVSVHDTGIGFAPDSGESIFGMFTQLGKRAPGRGTGLGIGLALVRKLVEAHGGKVTATSAGEGRGSDFTVSVPLAVDRRD
jgi:signal transduction histidine kinase